MNRGEIERLLGGYATGTLTPAEQKALFDAALENQEVFDRLANEEAVAEIFRDPAARAELLSSLDESPSKWHERWLAWWRPAAAALAVAALSLAVFVSFRKGPEPAKPQIFADARAPRETENRPSAALPPAKPVAPTPQPNAVAEHDAATEPGAEATFARRDKQKAAAAQLKDANDLKGANEAKLEAPPAMKETAGALAKTNAAPPAASAPVAQAPPPPPAPGEQRLASATQTVVVMDSAQQPELARQGAQSLYYAEPRSLGVQSFTAGQQGGAAGGPAGGVVGGRAGNAAGARPESRAEDQQKQEARDKVMQARPALSSLNAITPVAPFAGVRYRIQRQRDGTFEEADRESLKSGDVVRIEFTPNVPGRLVVTAGSRTLMSTEVERFQPYFTEPLNAEDRELRVNLIRRPAPGGSGEATPAVVYQTVSSDNYVVNTASSPLQFTIRLNYK